MKKDIVVFKIKNAGSGRSILSGLSHSAASHTDILYHTEVSSNDPTMGTVTLNREYAKENATVQIYTTPAEGFQLASYTVTPSWLEIKNNKFHMPKCDVNIVANFEQAISKIWYWNDTANKTIHLSGSKLDDNYIGGTDTYFKCRDINQNATKVIIENKIIPSSTESAFFNMNYLTSIENLSNLDTKLVENMSNMFYYCSLLESLDVTTLNTSNVTNMSWAFAGLPKVTSLDVSNFDTSKVTDMSGMFNSSGIKSIDVSTFDTSKVTSFRSFLGNCNSLESFTFNGLDLSSVESLEAMFYSCKSLKTVDFVDIITPKLKNCQIMFGNCTSITNIDMHTVTLGEKMYAGLQSMFNGCSNLVTVDIRGFNDPSKIEVFNVMFGLCGKLTTIYCNADWSGTLYASEIEPFQNCFALPGWTTAKRYGTYAKPRAQGGYFTTK